MLRKAIEKIEEMAKPLVIEVQGKTYAVACDGKYMEIRPEIDLPDVKDRW